jgi:hypothetical protein
MGRRGSGRPGTEDLGEDLAYHVLHEYNAHSSYSARLRSADVILDAYLVQTDCP